MLENLELRKAMHTAKAASEPTILQVSPLSQGLAASRGAAAGHLSVPAMLLCYDRQGSRCVHHLRRPSRCFSAGPTVPAGLRWPGTGQL